MVSRLHIERALQAAARLPVLDAALEVLGRPAFVISSQGKLRETNALGKAALARDRGLRARLTKAIATCPVGWHVRRIDLAAGQFDHLILLPIELPRAEIVAQRAAKVWKLTARQRDVLYVLAEGASTLSGAAKLQISERTFEVHVAAIFVKADVTSRAELLAHAFALP